MTLLRRKRANAADPAVHRTVEAMTIHAHALLFDNDGTLVSSYDSVVRCWTLPQELRQAPSSGDPHGP